MEPSLATQNNNSKKRNKKNNQKNNEEQKNGDSSSQNQAQSKKYVKKLPQHSYFDQLKCSPVRQATEEGFTGPADAWFDDAKYKQELEVNVTDLGKQDYYFDSYSHFYIHEEMLKDKVRTEAYRAAIERNPNDFKDKIVMDIGCGTGILSIFAARAGAAHVYAIENAHIALYAQEIVKRNGLQDKITVIKGKIEEITLPVEKVDIIISEWMGYFLLYESMLDCVLWARDKYLKPVTGKMLPDRALMYVAAIEDAEYKNRKIGFWEDVYGVDMSCLSNTVMKEPLVDNVEKDMIVSNSCQILDLNLVTMKKEDVEFSSEYSLTMLRPDRVHALVSWFDTLFSDLENPVKLSTSPYNRYTHWKQTVFYLEEDLDVESGEVLKGSVACRKSRTNFREQDIKFSYHFDGRLSRDIDFVQMYKLR